MHDAWIAIRADVKMGLRDPPSDGVWRQAATSHEPTRLKPLSLQQVSGSEGSAGWSRRHEVNGTANVSVRPTEYGRLVSFRGPEGPGPMTVRQPTNTARCQRQER